MARKRHRDGFTRQDDRDLSPIANELDSLVRPFEPSAVRSTLTEVEDRRNFSFDPISPPRTIGSRIARLEAVRQLPSRSGRPARPASFTRSGIKFAAPDYVIECVRRKQRKEVLHALRKVGRGRGGGPKRRRFFSDVRC